MSAFDFFQLSFLFDSPSNEKSHRYFAPSQLSQRDFWTYNHPLYLTEMDRREQEGEEGGQELEIKRQRG